MIPNNILHIWHSCQMKKNIMYLANLGFLSQNHSQKLANWSKLELLRSISWGFQAMSSHFALDQSEWLSTKHDFLAIIVCLLFWMYILWIFKYNKSNNNYWQPKIKIFYYTYRFTHGLLENSLGSFNALQKYASKNCIFILHRFKWINTETLQVLICLNPVWRFFV